MVFGREMKLLLDILSDYITEKCEFRTDYAENLKIRLCETHDFARKCLQKSSERQKQQYDLNEKNYQVGDLVWRNQKINALGRKQKISRNWNGPWIITKKLSSILYKIQHKKSLSSIVLHADNLKPYRGKNKIN